MLNINGNNQSKASFFEAALASIGDGVIATDKEGKIVFLNDRASEITGWSRDEAIGEKYNVVFLLVDKETSQVIDDIVMWAIEHQEPTGLMDNSVLITKFKENKYVSATASPIIDLNQNVSGGVLVFRDINRMKKIQMAIKNERDNFQNIYNSAPIGMIVIDEDVKIKKINRNALNFIDGENEPTLDQLFGNGIGCKNSLLDNRGCGYGENCKHCQIRAAIERALLDNVSTKNLVFSKELFRNGKSKEVWFKASITPMIDHEINHAVITLLDITESKNREAVILKARNQYLTMLETFPFMIWKTNVKGKLVYIDKKWFDFLGKSSDREITHNWFHHVHPEDHAKLISIHNSSIAYKKPHEIDVRVKDKNNEFRWIHCDLRPYFFENTFDGYMCMASDITERKSTEEKSERYKILSERANDIIFFVQQDGRIIDVNDAALNVYGYSYEEFTSMNVKNLRKNLSLTDADLKQAIEKELFTSTIHLRKDGSELPVEISSQGAFFGGKKIILSIIRDISSRMAFEKALKESEEKFRLIFQNTSTGLFVEEITEDQSKGKLIEVNERACEIFGYKKEDLPHSSPFHFIEDPKEMEEKIKKRDDQLNHGESKIELTCKNRNNEIIDVEVISRIFLHNKKKVLLEMVLDVTKQKENKKRLETAKLEAESANQAKSEFLANMSHEIRTPLNGMLGMIDLTLLTSLDNEQKDNLVTAKACASSLLQIINDILDFSKMEARKLIIENVNFNIYQLIEETIKLHKRSASQKNLELSYSFSSAIPEYLKGDPNRIVQVINNILGNAIKFTEQGEVNLSIRKVSETNNKITLKFSIKDTGIGISRDDMNKLFKSFSQVDGSFTRKVGGTGLGLVISKQLVEMMNGKIHVESTEGQGSTFSVMLSFDAGENLENESVKEELSKEKEHNYSILLAEDDKVNQKVIKRILENQGHSVHIANNGIEVVEMYQKGSFDLILMDIQMPEMDGIEATKRIRILDEKGKRIPIIAVTAHALQGDRERFLSNSLDEYVTKPINSNELFSVIEKVMERTVDGDNLNFRINKYGNIELYHKEINDTTELSQQSSFDDLSNLLDDLLVKLKNNEIETLDSIANKIKVQSNMMGFDEIKTLAFKTELASRKGNIVETFQCAIKLYDEFKVLKKTLGM